MENKLDHSLLDKKGSTEIKSLMYMKYMKRSDRERERAYEKLRVLEREREKAKVFLLFFIFTSFNQFRFLI